MRAVTQMQPRWQTHPRRGVSPIIATILLVAITVVLAAVLYILVSGLTGSSGSKPYAVAFADGTASQKGSGAATTFFDQKPISVTKGLTTNLFGLKIAKPTGVGIALGLAGGCAPTTTASNAFTTCSAPATVANPAAWYAALADQNGGVLATYDSAGWHYPAGISYVALTNAHQFVVISGGQAMSTPMAGTANTLSVYGTAAASVSGASVL